MTPIEILARLSGLLVAAACLGGLAVLLTGGLPAGALLSVLLVAVAAVVVVRVGLGTGAVETPYW